MNKSVKFEQLMQSRGVTDFSTCQDQYYNPNVQLAWEMFLQGFNFNNERQLLNVGTLDQLEQRFPDDFRNKD